MTNTEAIQDLVTLKEYFIHESGGSYPMCLEYAIKILEEPQSEMPEYAEWKEAYRKMTDCTWR